MNDMMAGFDKAIVQFLSPDKAAAYRKTRVDADKRRSDLIAQVRQHAMVATKRCLDALDYPQSSFDDISSAIAALLKAREAAQELDPPESA